ncbi:hypothetical protein C3F09_11860 [candidate division GN15 bacterium]|uniref:Peptidase M28 domain-containing protein n=1 Tax=candidate division GN15 bacterium TaxID=2072418 RepID=A0A855X292_9BACT|nr:MAG: hypothetical protein C3F09_11860 [candidate division GN15 bacterium]
MAPPAFDGARAYDYLKQQTAFGPRMPGSEASAECLQYLLKHFRGLAQQVDTQSFAYTDPYSGQAIPMVNVIARFRGLETGTEPILLVAHWDSRPRTDYPSDQAKSNEPIAGANDGASGVAVLMELADLFAAKPPACDVVILLVDGEDWGKEGDYNNYLIGSRYFASRGIRGHYRFGIVIDMVGDKDQQIYREGFSNEYYLPLNNMIWNAARDLGISTFHDSVKYTITDDHLPISAAGVPTVDIIDFDYPYWHTDQDTADKCSAESLSNVGRVLAEIAYNRTLWPRK